MPFNVLLLPLLGGYIFIINWNRTRFKAKRYAGYHLFFHAALAGVVFLVVAFALVTVVDLIFPELRTFWRMYVPIAYSGTSALALMLGAVAWIPLNAYFHDEREQIQKTIIEQNDFLEILLWRAMRHTRQVSLTIGSGKVYIGFVSGNVDPSYGRKYMKLLPMLSGYRDPDDKRLVITTDYSTTYEELFEKEEHDVDIDQNDFEIVIPVSEVVSINIFDTTAYDIFRSLEGDNPSGRPA